MKVYRVELSTFINIIAKSKEEAVKLAFRESIDTKPMMGKAHEITKSVLQANPRFFAWILTLAILKLNGKGLELNDTILNIYWSKLDIYTVTISYSFAKRL